MYIRKRRYETSVHEDDISVGDNDYLESSTNGDAEEGETAFEAWLKVQTPNRLHEIPAFLQPYDQTAREFDVINLKFFHSAIHASHTGMLNGLGHLFRLCIRSLLITARVVNETRRPDGSLIQFTTCPIFHVHQPLPTHKFADAHIAVLMGRRVSIFEFISMWREFVAEVKAVLIPLGLREASRNLDPLLQSLQERWDSEMKASTVDIQRLADDINYKESVRLPKYRDWLRRDGQLWAYAIRLCLLPRQHEEADRAVVTRNQYRALRGRRQKRDRLPLWPQGLAGLSMEIARTLSALSLTYRRRKRFDNALLLRVTGTVPGLQAFVFKLADGTQFRLLPLVDPNSLALMTRFCGVFYDLQVTDYFHYWWDVASPSLEFYSEALVYWSFSESIVKQQIVGLFEQLRLMHRRRWLLNVVSFKELLFFKGKAVFGNLSHMCQARDASKLRRSAHRLVYSAPWYDYQCQNHDMWMVCLVALHIIAVYTKCEGSVFKLYVRKRRANAYAKPEEWSSVLRLVQCCANVVVYHCKEEFLILKKCARLFQETLLYRLFDQHQPYTAEKLIARLTEEPESEPKQALELMSETYIDVFDEQLFKPKHPWEARPGSRYKPPYNY
ncbi:MAG: hypothetical protein KVP17_000758 [Porospora cf. gigantea B]|uniref:uncharacterized protein n=1 Tax=Porospora cf. gigantea B TaxID=2853592 RepID=UPI003571F8D4|nr:MAG: hypothetical protein KVP17_000758 [Porospora cf. gigantea B]